MTIEEADLAKKLVYQLMESKDASIRKDFLAQHSGSGWLGVVSNTLNTNNAPSEVLPETGVQPSLFDLEPALAGSRK